MSNSGGSIPTVSEQKGPDDTQALQDAIFTFGKEHQVLVCIEEMAELQKELCKDLEGRGCVDHIGEEITDCLIMLEQMIMLYHLKEKVRIYRKFKINRLLEKIDQWEMERETDS